jgi:hypothetical protein
MPNPLGIKWVAPDKRVLNIGQCPYESILLVFERAFADAAYALVGFDFHKNPVCAKAVDD